MLYLLFELSSEDLISSKLYMILAMEHGRALESWTSRYAALRSSLDEMRDKNVEQLRVGFHVFTLCPRFHNFPEIGGFCTGNFRQFSEKRTHFPSNLKKWEFELTISFQVNGLVTKNCGICLL